jgi:3-oxoacyl-[acyl-carrier-protein] synthase II
MGLTTSLGADLTTCWRRLLAGEIGVAPISLWDASEYSCKVAAEDHHVPEETQAEGICRSQSRKVARMLVPTAREAIKAAGLENRTLPGGEIGLALGTSVNYLNSFILKEYFRYRDRTNTALDMSRFRAAGRQPPGAFWRRTGDMIGALSARALELSGPLVLIDTACAASSHAIGEAYRLVRWGKVEAMVACGSCSHVTPISLLAFSLLGALSQNPNPAEASRPFDRLRDGFVMGEGAGAVVLESLEGARNRGARILAEVKGYGATVSAGNLVDPSPDGSAEARAMTLALEAAKMAPEEIDVIAAHGTSTPKGDANESTAIKRVFKDSAKRLLVFSNKGQIGHTISTAGVANLICVVKAMTDGRVPPTVNLRHPDPECDLDYVPNESRAAEVRSALVNAFGFGGQNVVIALRAWGAAEE